MASAAVGDKLQQGIIDAASDFAATEIAPWAGQFEEQGCIPRALIEKMAVHGYLGACFPECYGGLGLHPLYYGRLTEEIGKACASTRTLLTVNTSLVGETLLRWGTESQKQKYLTGIAQGKLIACFALTEPEVGTDAKSVRTHYKAEGDHYVISGVKKWITLGDIADVFMVIASNGGDVTAFLVERTASGVSTRPIPGLLASRAAHVAEVTFDQVIVPKENIVGREGSGFTYVVNTALDFGRHSIAWGGLGIAQGALEAMVNYARRRKQFGKGLYTFQLVKGMIGDGVAKVAAARALCEAASSLRNSVHTDAVMQTTVAKYFTSKVANEVSANAVQVHGGNGCYSQYPVERMFREAKLLEIIEGTSQVLQEVMADFGLRKFYHYPQG